MSDYDRPIRRKKLPLVDAIDLSRDQAQQIIERARKAASVDMVAREALISVGAGGAGVNLKGMKHDDGKEPLNLLSRVWLLGVASVMGFGARKYAAHNWRNGLERSRLISAALRHIIAYNEGEDQDPETGLSHLDHASCCLMFAREMHETRPDLDDRYKGKQNE